MSEKHTHGPWNNYQGDDIYCVYDANGKKICTIEPVDIVGWNAVHREEAEANEALIAAAPDLLEALETARKELAELKDQIGFRGMTIDAIDKCDAALSKARGAS